jgi:hypothetical protein
LDQSLTVADICKPHHRSAGKFYLWEGRIIGGASVVSSAESRPRSQAIATLVDGHDGSYRRLRLIRQRRMSRNLLTREDGHGYAGPNAARKGMKLPESTDFEVKVFDSGADVIFKPTSSYYWFSRFADFADIVKYGHLSQSANIRHTGWSRDTDGYDPSEVLAEARRAGLRAAQDAYEIAVA